MAHVRMSEDLKSTILKNAEEQYDKSHIKPSRDPKLSNAVRQAVIESPFQQAIRTLVSHDYFSKHIHMSNNSIKLTAGKWSNVTSTNDIREFLGSFRYLEEDHNITKSIEMKFKSNIEPGHRTFTVELDPYINLPYLTSSYNSNSTIHEDDLSSKAKEQLNPLLNAAYDGLEDWNKKKDNLKYQMKELVNRVNTLKQFLDVYPAGESLVPKDKIAKMHERTTRKMQAEQVKQELGFDLDQHNQTALISSLLNED